MSDLFSLSVLQVLSVLSFITSLLAVVRVGTVSFNRFQHNKFEANVNHAEIPVATSLKVPMWNWKATALSASFSLGSILGEDEPDEPEDGNRAVGGYTAGTTLVRMDWQVTRPHTVPAQPQHSQPPISMAKLIMSRHLQRKSGRSPRRSQSISRTPTPLSRLTQHAV